MQYLFPNFLANESEYAQAEAYWAQIWASIPRVDSINDGWRDGWFTSQAPKDGNPIFTAISDAQKKAIRVIQYEPTVDTIELDFWIDTYGGSLIEPVSVRELVIACALSSEAAQRALKLMSSWMIGEIEFSNETPAARGAATIRGAVPQWQQPTDEPDISQTPTQILP